MLVFFQERLVYLAVPKTGSTSVERALHRRASVVFRDPPGIKHTNARGYDRKFKKIFERKNLPPVETLAVIREPVSWLGSWYRYRQRSALSGHKNSTQGISFDDFVEAYLSDTPPDFANIGAQSRFLCNDAGELAVDHLFVYEDFGPFISFLSDRLNREIVLDHVNASPKMDVVLSADLKNAFEERFARDFELHTEAAKTI